MFFEWTEEDQKKLDKAEKTVYRLKERKRMYQKRIAGENPTSYQSSGRSKFVARF